MSWAVIRAWTACSDGILRLGMGFDGKMDLLQHFLE